MSKCSNCPYSSFGGSDPSFSVCDGCKNDPDTGWGGFTDHSLGKHFSSEEERVEYRKKREDYESDEDDTI